MRRFSTLVASCCCSASRYSSAASGRAPFLSSLGKQGGLLDLSPLSFDECKIKANVSNKRVLTAYELEFLIRFVDEWPEERVIQNIKNDDILGDLRGFDKLPGKSKEVVQKAARYYVRKLILSKS
jgi:hypothetical protein